MQIAQYNSISPSLLPSLLSASCPSRPGPTLGRIYESKYMIHYEPEKVQSWKVSRASVMV